MAGRACALLAVLLGTMGVLSTRAASRPADPGPAASCREHATPAHDRAPARRLVFVENRGQFDRRVAYAAQTGPQTIWLSRAGIAFDVVRGAERLVFAQRLIGANAGMELSAGSPQPGVRHYLTAGGVNGARGFAQVVYREAWDGIDVRLVGDGERLEQDFIVHPHADLRQIRVGYRGIRGLRIGPDGGLLIRTAFGILRESAPRVYQTVGGRRQAVRGRFRLLDRRSYTFAVRRYRRDAALVIDPAIAYARYLGGSDRTPGAPADTGREQAADVAVDAAGNAYVTGVTYSPDFTGADPARTHYNRNGDAFVSKLSPAGELVYTTYLGTDSLDQGHAIALDGAGNAYVTGVTTSQRGLATAGAAQSLNGGANVAASLIRDAFIAKLDPSGARVVWSTYLGGAGDDSAADVAVDAAGSVVVAGTTDSRNLPVVNAWQPSPAGPAEFPTFSRFDDAFVAKVSADGARLIYSSYLGGAGDDRGRGVAVDAGGNAYVSGQTASTDFPTRAPLQAARRGPSDAFVAKVPPQGLAPSYATYFGGSGQDGAYAVAVDASQRPWLAGDTDSRDLPVRRAAQRDPGVTGADALLTTADGFVAALDASGASLAYGTYLGGWGNDRAFDLGLDARGDVYVTGSTSSAADPGRGRQGFPAVGALQRVRPLDTDAFVTKIGAGDGAFAFSSPLGGSQEEGGFGIAPDASGRAHVVGYTLSPNLPRAVGPGRNGVQDGFIVKVDPAGAEGGGVTRASPAYVYADLVGPARIRSGRPATFTVVVGNSGDTEALRVPLWIDGIPADATFTTDVAIVPPPAADAAQRATLAALPSAVRHGGRRLIPLFIASIPPRSSLAFTLTLTVPTDRELTLRAWADPPMVDPGATARVAQQRLDVRAAVRGCLEVIITEAIEDVFKDALPVKCIVEMELLLRQLGDDVVDEFIDQLEGKPPAITSNHGLFVQVMLTLGECIRDVTGEIVLEAKLLNAAAEVILTLIDVGKLEHVSGCEEAFTAAQGLPPSSSFPGAGPGVTWSVESRSSHDPNDKSASAGHGRGRFVARTEPLPYAISFENLAKATAPAEQVVITDRLSPALDLATVGFGPVIVGGRRAGPVAPAPSLATHIDLSPGIRVAIEGSLDRATRVVTWRFRTVDPRTGDAPADPLAGFLPPNVRPPEGQGMVTLFATPRRTVRNGTRIRNAASIVFDANPAIVTPARVNRIDAAPPASRAQRAARGRGNRVRVAWRRSDRGAGVGRVAVMVSENGRRFRRARVAGGRRKAATVALRRGRRYVVFTAAQDRAGNPEREPAVGDLMTPALRAARRGSVVTLRARFYVQREATLTATVPRARLLRGSRLGSTTLRRTRGRISARAQAGPITLVLRFRPTRSSREALVRAGSGTLRLPFR